MRKEKQNFKFKCWSNEIVRINIGITVFSIFALLNKRFLSTVFNRSKKNVISLVKTEKKEKSEKSIASS